MSKFSSKMRGARSGFSLLEVLFTVLILAVLAAVAVPLYSNTQKDAQLKACKSNVQAIANAESKFKFETGAYTATGASLVNYGIAAFPTCPGGSAYTVAAPAAGGCTITCGDATHSANTMTLP